MDNNRKFLNNFSFLYSVTFIVALLKGVTVSREFESDLNLKNKLPKSNTDVYPPNKYVNAFATAVPEIERFINLQVQLENIASNLRIYDLPQPQRNILSEVLVRNPKIRNLIDECNLFQSVPSCSRSSYREYDGTCNNLWNRKWGSSGTEYDRMLPPLYEGASSYRKSVTGEQLPDPRNISLKLHSEKALSQTVSALFIFFGQLLSHDIVDTPQSTVNGSMKYCCDIYKEHPLCAPFYLPKDDPFFSKINVPCFGFLRNAPFPKCNFDKRGFINMATSFIDGSIIYGNDERKAYSVRSKDESGRLLTQFSDGGELLPSNTIEEPFCIINRTDICFVSGDARLNQHTILSILTHVFVRFHNHVANNIRLLNRHWKGEKIFQETRRIVGAVFQFITYQEFLPLLLGPSMMRKYNLDVDFPSQYIDTIRPIQLIEFGTAAFRLHSMVPQNIGNFPSTRLKSTYSNTEPLFKGELESLIGEVSEVASYVYKPSVNEDLTNLLYMPSKATFGFDITVLNVFRGRDHGLPTYIDVIAKCSNGQINIQDFPDLIRLMPIKNINFLRTIYRDVRDIDLWVGMISEGILDGGVIGYSAGCIAGEQFKRLKFGDSFFFTHVNGRNPFTRNQLQFIKSMTFSKLICETTNMKRVRQYPFQIPNQNNKLIFCSFPQTMNLQPWKEF